MVACALVVTALLVRRELFERPAALPAIGIQPFPSWRQYAQDGYKLGPSNAPVTLVEFADFECPACAALHREIDSLTKVKPGVVRVVYRHYPLRIHRFAIPAARASDCAGRQGRFTEIHDLLFENQDSLGLAPWSWFAARAGVPDTSAFVACFRSNQPDTVLKRDTTTGARLAIAATPMVLVGGVRFYGAIPFDTLRALVERTRTTGKAN